MCLASRMLSFCWWMTDGVVIARISLYVWRVCKVPLELNHLPMPPVYKTKQKRWLAIWPYLTCALNELVDVISTQKIKTTECDCKQIIFALIQAPSSPALLPPAGEGGASFNLTLDLGLNSARERNILNTPAKSPFPRISDKPSPCKQWWQEARYMRRRK